MRAVRPIGVLGVAVTLLASAANASAAGQMQKAPGGQMQKAPSGQMQKVPTQMERKIEAAPPIKIEATALTVTPASGLKAGDQVTVTLTVKNAGTGAVAKVPWSIHLHTANQTLAQGEQTNVGPGATFQVTARWTATAGQKLLQGYVDPGGRTLKNTAPPAVQVKELTITVAQAVAAQPAAAPATLVTQILDHERARAAGAGFNHGEEGPATCFQRGQFGPSQLGNHAAASPPARDASVIFLINCVPTGARATPEAFMNWELKHGWKVKRYEVVNALMDNGEWQFPNPPAVGSSRPYVKAHLWSNPGRGLVYFGVKIYIEGPEGTDPYQ